VVPCSKGKPMVKSGALKCNLRSEDRKKKKGQKKKESTRRGVKERRNKRMKIGDGSRERRKGEV